MMNIDFDSHIDRHNTYSTQWDYIADRFGRNDIIPFSISDTDFAVPPEIIETLNERLKHPIFGYTRWNHDDFKKPIATWFMQRGGSYVDTNWIVYSPSVIWTLATLIRMLSEPGDSVAVFNPMYDAFFNTIQSNQRKICPVQLNASNNIFTFDQNDLYKACSDPNVKLLLLTNPHNPTGKVFTKDELKAIVSIAKETNTFIISDDIHRDIILQDVPYSPITDYTTKHVALLCSASKTFNIPGLIGSYVFLPDSDVKDSFLYGLKQKNALSSVSIFGMYAQTTAYTSCAYYVDELTNYIKLNMKCIETYFNEHLPNIKFMIPQATYLAWIDISSLHVTSLALQQACVDYGKVGIMSGSVYGNDAFMRMCVGCPRSKLLQGLDGFYKGVRGLCG